MKRRGFLAGAVVAPVVPAAPAPMVAMHEADILPVDRGGNITVSIDNCLDIPIIVGNTIIDPGQRVTGICLSSNDEVSQ